MTRQVRFGKDLEACHPACSREPVPHGIAHRMQIKRRDQSLEHGA